jgi:hypothetical protein
VLGAGGPPCFRHPHRDGHDRILNASTGITGTFSVVNGTSIDSTKHFSVSYNPKTIVLTVVSGPAA